MSTNDKYSRYLAVIQAPSVASIAEVRMASDARRDAVEILRLHNALMDIAEMPVYDQDDAVRVRDVARRALGLGLAPEAER